MLFNNNKKKREQNIPTLLRKNELIPKSRIMKTKRQKKEECDIDIGVTCKCLPLAIRKYLFCIACCILAPSCARNDALPAALNLY